MVADAPIVIRPARSSDRNLIIDSWIKSHRFAASSSIDGRSYFAGQNRLCNALLDRCACLVAGFDEDPDTILGWAVTSTGAVHYVWTRPQFRKTGIALRLLAPYLEQPTIYTHAHRGSIAIPKSWVFNPYHAFELAYSHRKEQAHEAA